MININLYTGNVLDYLDDHFRLGLPKYSFAFYDPPYEMNIINNDWDNSGIIFSKEYNQGLFDVMKPGAFVLCYGHARVFHRVMVALEDAGFIVHKAIFGWGYSSGNPQGAANLQRNLDNYYADKYYKGYCTCDNPTPNLVGNEGYINLEFKNIGIPVTQCSNCHGVIKNVLQTKQWGATTGKKKLGGAGYGNDNVQIITEPLTIEAKLLKDYTYGLSSFKPMVEPIILVQKPFEGSAVESIVKHGTGIVNVHETRYIDRWPGNFIAVHEVGCEFIDGKWICVNGCEIGEQIKIDPDFTSKYPTFAYSEIDAELASVDAMVIESKPNKKEKNLKDFKIDYNIESEVKENWQNVSMVAVGLLKKVISESTVKWNIDLSGKNITAQSHRDTLSTTLTTINKITISQIYNLLTPSLINEFIQAANLEMVNGGNHVDDVEKSNKYLRTITSTVEMDGVIQDVKNVVSKLLSIISVKENWQEQVNNHPTLKPIKLNQYLSKLFLPPQEFGDANAFVPFCGSGSEILGLVAGGWKWIDGVDISGEFTSFANLRLEEFIRGDKQILYYAESE